MVQAMAENADFTYAQGITTVWSLIEMNFGLVCNCMTRLKPFIRHHFTQNPVCPTGKSSIRGPGPCIKQEQSNSMPWVWRGDHADKGYHLEAYTSRFHRDIREVAQNNSDRQGSDIYIKHEYEVRYNENLPTSKQGSTEHILNAAEGS